MALEEEDVEVVTHFIDKATVWILAFVRNAAGALVNPTAIKITIIDPDDTVQVPSEGNGDDDMTQYESETGIYEYYYHKGIASDPMASGQWRGRVDVIDDTLLDAIISSQSFSFTVR